MKQKTVLIVEDEIAIAHMYKYKLELHQYTVVIATNGITGLKVLKSQDPVDLVLIDLRMPIMTGDVMLEKMRNIPHRTQTPVIILTNLSKEEAPNTIWHYGISGYYVKAHSTPQQLLHIVDKTIRNA
jgi:putative two-component system response regulator